MMDPSSSSTRPNLKRKNSPGNRSDAGWKYGTEVDGNPKKVKCNYCQGIICGGVYRFKHHLAGSKKDTHACLKVPDDVRFEMKKLLGLGDAIFGESNKSVQPEKESLKSILKEPTSSTRKMKITTNQMLRKDLREEVYQQICKFFYTSAIPFNYVENPEFIKMCQMIGNYGSDLEPLSCHEISEKYLNKEVMNLLEEHKEQWKKTGCSIMMLDGQTEYNFFVNSSKGTIFLSSIDTFECSEGTDKVFQMLDDIVKQVGEENVVQVITDNTKDYEAAGKMLMEKRKTIFWTPCIAYCIDLILEDFGKNLEIHHLTIDQVQKVMEMLKLFTEGKDLIKLAGIHFATSYLTLESFDNKKDALTNMFNSSTWNSSEFAISKNGQFVQSLIMSSKFWEDVKTCLVDTSPLIKILQLIDSKEKPTMGFIYEEINRAKGKFEAYFEIIKKRPLYPAAYCLNPQFRYGPNFKVDPEVTKGLYECLERMIPNEDERVKIHLQLDEFKNKKGLFGLKEALKTKDMKAPAMWWESYGIEVPELQKFAIRILSLTCSSSRCKRKWNAFERVHMKWRKHLLQKKMNDLIVVMFEKFIETNSYEGMQSDDELIAKKMTNYNEDTHVRKDGDEEKGDKVEGEDLHLDNYENKEEDDKCMEEQTKESMEKDVKLMIKQMKEMIEGIEWMKDRMEAWLIELIEEDEEEDLEEWVKQLMEKDGGREDFKLMKKCVKELIKKVKCMEELMKSECVECMEESMESEEDDYEDDELEDVSYVTDGDFHCELIEN